MNNRLGEPSRNGKAASSSPPPTGDALQETLVWLRARILHLEGRLHETTREVARLRSLVEGSHAAAQPVPVPGAPRDGGVAQLRETLEARLQAKDFLFIANLALETLLRPGQDKTPDEQSKLFDEFMPRVIQASFKTPEELTYARPWRDQHIPFSARGTWEQDRYRELLIHALMVGASLRTLPPPHDTQFDFYQFVASQQRYAIRQAQSSAIHQEYLALRQYRGADHSQRLSENSSRSEWIDRLLQSAREDYECHRTVQQSRKRVQAADAAREADLQSQIEQLRRSGRDPALIQAEIEHLRQNHGGR